MPITVCAEVIGKFGGFVAKYMGDGVLAYFGYPQADNSVPISVPDLGKGRPVMCNCANNADHVRLTGFVCQEAVLANFECHKVGFRKLVSGSRACSSNGSRGLCPNAECRSGAHCCIQSVCSHWTRISGLGPTLANRPPLPI